MSPVRTHSSQPRVSGLGAAIFATCSQVSGATSNTAAAGPTGASVAAASAARMNTSAAQRMIPPRKLARKASHTTAASTARSVGAVVREPRRHLSSTLGLISAVLVTTANRLAGLLAPAPNSCLGSLAVCLAIYVTIRPGRRDDAHARLLITRGWVTIGPFRSDPVDR